MRYLREQLIIIVICSLVLITPVTVTLDLGKANQKHSKKAGEKAPVSSSSMASDFVAVAPFSQIFARSTLVFSPFSYSAVNSSGKVALLVPEASKIQLFAFSPLESACLQTALSRAPPALT